MTEAGSDDPKVRKLAGEVLELYLVYCVERGLVEVGNRAIREIFDDFRRDTQEALDKHDLDFPLGWDHRDFLLGQASSVASQGALEIAVVLYATWIEHYVNKLLLFTLERKDLSSQSSRAIIRELRLPTKVTALWELAHLPPLSSTHLQLIDRVASLRNSFVHYKWPRVVYEEFEGSQRRESREVISRIDSLIQVFHEVEDQALWCGRRDEIIQAFRQSYPG